MNRYFNRHFVMMWNYCVAGSILYECYNNPSNTSLREHAVDFLLHSLEGTGLFETLFGRDAYSIAFVLNCMRMGQAANAIADPAHSSMTMLYNSVDCIANHFIINILLKSAVYDEYSTNRKSSIER